MLQRLGNILLIAVVLCATTGLVVQKHFMHGELYSTAVFSSPESCCADDLVCECCDEESDVVKVEDTFRTSQQQTVPAVIQPATILRQPQAQPSIQSMAQYGDQRRKLPLVDIAPEEWMQVFLL